jgi:hypothetical protein
MDTRDDRRFGEKQVEKAFMKPTGMYACCGEYPPGTGIRRHRAVSPATHSGVEVSVRIRTETPSKKRRQRRSPLKSSQSKTRAVAALPGTSSDPGESRMLCSGAVGYTGDGGVISGQNGNSR